MASDPKATVVLCWHMHQPCYQDQRTGDFLFPWTYLHAIKDYADMAAHLEAHPDARAVVNFAPVLLEQIEAYLIQIERWRSGHGEIQDEILGALASETLPAPGTPGFLGLMDKCLRANHERIIKRFAPYTKLASFAESYRSRPEIQIYISEQYLADLLVWYHIGWLGETIRRTHTFVLSLQEKGRAFTFDDRKALVELIFETLSGIGPRYRRLADRGQIELAVSPYSHPILPLLISLESAREALPELVLPDSRLYPGGEFRAHWQLTQALRVFYRFFRRQPVGCWASEGALSQAALALLSEQGFKWTASGDSVLANSAQAAAQGHREGKDGEVIPGRIHTPYRFGGDDITVFFRDDGLSDRIGFSYSDWHAEDAVSDLIVNMETIAKHSPSSEPCVISIIMDGENAWEYYPENGYHFLDELYRRLEAHPYLRLSTYSQVLAESDPSVTVLPRLTAGSWIYGTFSTWIGDPDKNRAWDWLCEAKHHYDSVLGGSELSEEQKEIASRQLAYCEGSDWYWWFGDYNPPQIVHDFEFLFRRHLVNLYSAIKLPAPPMIFQQLSQGGGMPSRGGTMRTGHFEPEREPGSQT